MNTNTVSTNENANATIKMDAKALKKNLDFVKVFIPTRETLVQETANYIHVKTGQDVTMFEANSLDCGVRINVKNDTLGFSDAKEADMLLGKNMVDVINEFGDQQMSITVNGDDICKISTDSVEWANNRNSLLENYMPVKAIPADPKAETFNVNVERLVGAISGCASISEKEKIGSRYNSVIFIENGETLEIISMYGAPSILADAKIPVFGNKHSDNEIAIPAQNAKLIASSIMAYAKANDIENIYMRVVPDAGIWIFDQNSMWYSNAIAVKINNYCENIEGHFDFSQKIDVAIDEMANVCNSINAGAGTRIKTVNTYIAESGEKITFTLANEKTGGKGIVNSSNRSIRDAHKLNVAVDCIKNAVKILEKEDSNHVELAVGKYLGEGFNFPQIRLQTGDFRVYLLQQLTR